MKVSSNIFFSFLDVSKAGKDHYVTNVKQFLIVFMELAQSHGNVIACLVGEVFSVTRV